MPVFDSTGTVKAVSARVTRFKPGDKVLALVTHGHLGRPLTVAIIENGGVGGEVDNGLQSGGNRLHTLELRLSASQYSPGDGTDGVEQPLRLGVERSEAWRHCIDPRH